MTDNLLQKLEEKMIQLLTELEALRKEVLHLKKDNSLMKMEKENYMQKMQDLISLLDTIPMADDMAASNQIFLQSRDDYATA